MKTQHVVILCIAAFAAIALTFLLKPGASDPAAPSADIPLVPSLAGVELTGFHMIDGVDQVHLTLKDDQWVVKSLFNYPADTRRLKDLVRQLQDLKVREEFPLVESRVSSLRLGIPEVEPAESTVETGVRLRIHAGEGAPLVDLVLGEMETPAVDPSSGMPPIPTGRYIRAIQQPERIHLVSQTLTQATVDPSGWLAKDLISIRQIRSVEVKAPKGKTLWKLERKTTTEPFTYAFPKWMKVDNSKTGALRNLLAGGRLESIADPELPDEELGLKEPRTAIIETFEDFQYTLEIGEPTDGGLIPLRLAIAATFPETRPAIEGESQEQKLANEDAFAEEQATLKKRLADQKTRESWTYLVPKWSIAVLLEDAKAFQKKK